VRSACCAALPISLTTANDDGGTVQSGRAGADARDRIDDRRIPGEHQRFSLWSFIVTAIGLGVLYRRNSRNIAIA
jgi:hypothetical protein